MIRTKLIHDANKPNPQYRNLVHGVRTIVHQEGLSGVYRGLIAVMARQGANSAVRFTVYGQLKQLLEPLYPVNPQIGKSSIPVRFERYIFF